MGISGSLGNRFTRLPLLCPAPLRLLSSPEYRLCGRSLRAGSARPLLEQKSTFESWAIPSRDGQHVAIMGQTISANLWMLEDF